MTDGKNGQTYFSSLINVGRTKMLKVQILVTILGHNFQTKCIRKPVPMGKCIIVLFVYKSVHII